VRRTLQFLESRRCRPKPKPRRSRQGELRGAGRAEADAGIDAAIERFNKVGVRALPSDLDPSIASLNTRKLSDERSAATRPPSTTCASRRGASIPRLARILEIDPDPIVEETIEGERARRR
jgi:hypothetical protein